MPNPPTSTAAPQGAAYDAVTHLTLIPIFLITFIVAIVLALHAPAGYRLLHGWLVVVAFGWLLGTAKTRLYSLRVQDRVIRLEERLRLGALAPAVDASRLSMPQIIALRFACDEELPALAARTLAENLEPKAIKESIVTWRRDDIRI
jgi:hypothetical protein